MESRTGDTAFEANHTRTVLFGGLAISDMVRMIQPNEGLFQQEYELEPD